MGISLRAHYRHALALLGLAFLALPAAAQFETKGIIFPQGGSYKDSTSWIKVDTAGHLLFSDPSLPSAVTMDQLIKTNVAIAPAQIQAGHLDLGTGAGQVSTSVIPEGSNHYYHTTSTLADVAAAGYITAGGADARYLRSFTELDPIFSAHPAHLVTLTSMTQWNQGGGALKVESDPVFTVHPAHQVNATSITAWNHGSHALFSEADPLFAVHPAHLVTLTSMTAWNAATHITPGGGMGDTLIESDPVFGAHPAHYVSLTSMTQWNLGGHALQAETEPAFKAHPAYLVSLTSMTAWNGRLKTETDPVFSAHPAYYVSQTSMTAWNAATHTQSSISTGRINGSQLTLTTNSQTATLTVSDISAWKSPPFTWIDGTDINTIANINLGRLSAGNERLFVQGYGPTAWSADLTPEVTGGNQNSYIASNLGSSAYYLMDNSYSTRVDANWLGFSPVYVGYKFPSATLVHRVKLYPYGGARFHWNTVQVLGSNDSTNGVDGNWATLATATLTQYATNTIDFTSNATAYKWIKVIGNPWSNDSSYSSLGEVEMFNYIPAPQKTFAVDAQGNPVTTGKLTAAAITLTTNSQTATISPADVIKWNGYTGSSGDYLPLGGGTIMGTLEVYNSISGTPDAPTLHITGTSPAVRFQDNSSDAQYAVHHTLNLLKFMSKVGAGSWQQVGATDANGNWGFLGNVDSLSMSAPTINVNGNELRIKSPTTAEAYFKVVDENPASNLHIFSAGYYPGNLKLTLSDYAGSPSYSEKPFMEISSGALNLGNTSRLTIGKMAGATGTATVAVPAVETAALKMTSGAGAGKVMISDASGNASWGSASSAQGHGTASFVFFAGSIGVSNQDMGSMLSISQGISLDAYTGIPMPFSGHLIATAANTNISSIDNRGEPMIHLNIAADGEGVTNNIDGTILGITASTNVGRFCQANQLSGSVSFRAGDYLRAWVFNDGTDNSDVILNNIIVTVTVAYD